jgi:hypothetical protein
MTPRTMERYVKEYLEPIRKGQMPRPVGIHITWDMFCMLCEVASPLIKKYGWDSYKKYIDNWTTRLDKTPTRFKKHKKDFSRKLMDKIGVGNYDAGEFYK